MQYHIQGEWGMGPMTQDFVHDFFQSQTVYCKTVLTLPVVRQLLYNKILVTVLYVIYVCMRNASIFYEMNKKQEKFLFKRNFSSFSLTV